MMNIALSLIGGFIGYLAVKLLSMYKKPKITIPEIYACYDALKDDQDYILEMTRYNLSMTRIQFLIQQSLAISNEDYETAEKIKEIVHNIEELLNDNN